MKSCGNEIVCETYSVVYMPGTTPAFEKSKYSIVYLESRLTGGGSSPEESVKGQPHRLHENKLNLESIK